MEHYNLYVEDNFITEGGWRTVLGESPEEVLDAASAFYGSGVLVIVDKEPAEPPFLYVDRKKKMSFRALNNIAYAYYSLLLVPYNNPAVPTCEFQSALCCLRSAIAEATGARDEVVQNFFEHKALITRVYGCAFNPWKTRKESTNA